MIFCKEEAANMKIDKLLIIPDRQKLSEYEMLAKQYNLGFEFNDFFIPATLDDEKLTQQTIQQYIESKDMPRYCTSHGAFFDITIFSDDIAIYNASDYRVEQSLQIAQKLGAKGVVFHTNYITNFLADTYRDGWVKRNIEYWTKKADQYKNINIYIENMFDDTPELISRLGEGMTGVQNFGICFDYAHAQVFGNSEEIGTWVKALAPYVKHIHINDNDLKKDLHLAVGDGCIDWQEFKCYYEEYFYDATVLMEVNGIDKIKRSLEFLYKL